MKFDLALPIAAVVLGGAFAAAQAPKAPGSQDVKIAPVTTGLLKGSLSFRLAEDQDRAELVYAKDRRALFFSVARGSMAANASNVPIADKLRLLKPLLTRFFADEGHESEYEFAIANYVELGPRVALAAATSSQWDVNRGQPFSGGADQFVKHLLDSRNLFPELADLLGESGYSVKIADVEQVIVEPLRSCEASTELKPSGRTKGSEKVPCSMSIRFLLSRKER
jgi:hypothetical protein